MLGPRHARGDVVVDHVGHAVAVDQPVAGGEIHAGLPFLGTYFAHGSNGNWHWRSSRVHITRHESACFALPAGRSSAAFASAQTYPAKPVRLIIPFPPGGSNDVVGARHRRRSSASGSASSVVIDNRGGAGGTIGTNAAAKSPRRRLYAAADLGRASRQHRARPHAARHRCNGSRRSRARQRAERAGGAGRARRSNSVRS